MMTNEQQAKEAFIKRGFWPNEVMWQCWFDAWMQSAAKEQARCCSIVYGMAGSDNVAQRTVDAIKGKK